MFAVMCTWVRKEAWLSVSMEIRKNRFCFLGIAVISKCLKLGRSVVFTRTFCSSSGCVFLSLLELREAGRQRSPGQTRAVCLSHPHPLSERCHSTKRPGVRGSCFFTAYSVWSGEISPEQNTFSLPQKNRNYHFRLYCLGPPLREGQKEKGGII